MKALTVHQPWASLIALGVKTIETRSWPTSYRGPLAIHAGRKRPRLMHLPKLWSRGKTHAEQDAANRRSWLVVDTITDPAYMGPRSTRVPKRATAPTLFYPREGPHGRPWNETLGTSATDQGTAVYLPLGAIVATCELVSVRPVEELGDGPSFMAWDLNENRQLGDFTKGRFAWQLRDIRPLPEPSPAKGAQRLWEWSDDSLVLATDGKRR